MNKYPHQPNILINIRNKFFKSVHIDWFGGLQHHADALNFFIVIVCRVQIHKFCTIINKNIKGSFSESSININFVMHQLALEKRKRYTYWKKITINKIIVFFYMWWWLAGNDFLQVLFHLNMLLVAAIQLLYTM